jgi:hypothetical protein
LGYEFSYLNATGTLIYVANNFCSDIAFAVNLIVRYSVAPTKCHWIGIKNIFRHLKGTRDLGLFYSRSQDPTLIGYTDAGYFLIPIMAYHKLILYFYKVEPLSLGNHPSKLW